MTETATNEATENISAIKEITPEIDKEFDEFMNSLTKSQENLKAQQENLSKFDENAHKNLKEAKNELKRSQTLSDTTLQPKQ